MWVTVLVSQPSVSMETETTQRICSPRRPGRPTVFITSRSSALSLASPCAAPAPSRAASSRLNCSISGPAASRKSLVERVAGFDLAGVDQQRARAGEAGALVVVVAEQLQMAGMKGRALAFLGVAALEAGDPFEHQLGDRGVLAHHDEDGRHADPGALPALELALIVAVERVQRGLQRVGQVEGAELGGARGGLRQVLADVLPQVAIDDRIGLHEVVAHRHARQLDDAALDRVHQAEIGHDPGEERALLIARAA